MVLLFYTTNISVDLAHHEIFRAKVGKGGIKSEILSTGQLTFHVSFGYDINLIFRAFRYKSV